MQSFVKEPINLHQKLFDEMLIHFNLNAKAIAAAAGVSEVMVSRFRNGRMDLGASKLIALLENVPDEAREWYIASLLGVKPGTSLRSLVLSASPKEKAEVLSLIAGPVLEALNSVETEIIPEAV